MQDIQSKYTGPDIKSIASIRDIKSITRSGIESQTRMDITSTAPTTDIVSVAGVHHKSGIELALEDIEAGRIHHYNSVAELRAHFTNV